MKSLIVFLAVVLMSCGKEREVKPIQEKGQLYFWNPYGISNISEGIDIFVDDTLRIHNYKASGITNGFWFETNIGVHKWFYVVSTTPMNCCNYGLHGQTTIQANHNDTIQMVK